MAPQSSRLFGQVATRRRIATLSMWSYRFFIALAIGYAAVLLVSRLLGLIPDYFEPWTVAIVPLGALVIGVIAHRGITVPQAARLVDQAMDTKDLYLTAATLQSAPGEYKPLVAAAAEEKAATIHPRQVVPYRGGPRVANAVVILTLLLLGAMFLPQLDPFKKDEQRRIASDRIKKLEEEKLAAKEKIEALSKQDLDAKTSKEVERMLAELKKTFNELKKNDKEQNLAKLNEQQKQVGEKWRENNEKKMKEASQRDQFAQQLGGVNQTQKAQEWKKELAQGKSDALKQEMKEIQQLAEQAKQETSEVKKNEMQQEMQKRIQEMSEFAKSQGTTKEMQQALQKAAEQLAQSGDPQAQKEAMEAVQQQMQLSEKQLEQLAQSVRDQKSLEEALQAIQNAKQANSKDDFDPQECKTCQNMSEYAELFKKLGGGEQMADGSGDPDGSAENEKQGQGDGQGEGEKQSDKQGNGGTGGQGQGRGGKPPEVDQKTAFKTERSKSALHAGKTLMQWKTQEEADKGESKLDYKKAVDAVKQGVSEAILSEQIPPGYHEAIKKYFDQVEVPKEKK